MPDGLRTVARGLAAAFAAGEWEPAAMTRRGQRAVGQRRVWVRDLAAAARLAYPEAPRDRPRELAAFLGACPPFLDAAARAGQRSERPLAVTRWYISATSMGERRWPVAPLDTVGDVHDLLGVTAANLRWLADPRQHERQVVPEPLRHYRYRWAPKDNGGVRLIEAPKPILKHFQRVVRREILEQVPPHPAAHGFRPGRSALTYASGHTGQAVVIHLDLEDFFGSVTAGRVYGIYRSCGYPEGVAHVLTALVTNSMPERVWASVPSPPAGPGGAHHRLRQHLVHPHLPQGAPTSPALANLATFRLNHRKTSVRRASQHQRLAGIVVNDRPNVDGRDYDRLKATLTNAARHGPASQNRADRPESRPSGRARRLGRAAQPSSRPSPRGHPGAGRLER